jgi:hypothetical protein
MDHVRGFSTDSETGYGGYSAYRGGTNGAPFGSLVLGIGHTTRALPGAGDLRCGPNRERPKLTRPFGWILDPASAQLRFFDVAAEFPDDLISVNPTSLIALPGGAFELFTTEASGFFADRNARCEVVSYRFAPGPQRADLPAIPSGRAQFGAGEFRARAGRLVQEQWRCALGGLDDHVIYGPYQKLPPGRYEAQFRLETHALAGGRDARLLLEVVADAGAYLATARTGTDEPLPSGGPIVGFDHRRERDALEFRVHARGYSAGELRFAGVTVTPLPER